MAEIRIIPETIQLIRLSDEEYFSEKYQDYLSNSKIGLLNPDEGGSIKKFEEGFDNNYSDSYALGSAVHCSILQSDDFNISDIKKPNSKLGIFIEEVYNQRQKGLKIVDAMGIASKKVNYYSNVLSTSRIKNAISKGLSFYLQRISLGDVRNTIFLSESLYDHYIGATESLLNNHTIQNLLKPIGLFDTPEVYNEYAILCDLEFMTDNGEFIPIKFKAKIDNFVIDHETKKIVLNDLKTTGKYINYFMGNNVETDEGIVWYDGSFQKYHYYRQLGIYLWLLQAALQTHMPQIINYKYSCNIIAVESFPEYRSDYFKISGNIIKKGLAEFKLLLSYYAEWLKHQ